MSMYSKIFTKILDSSIWLEPTTTRIVWITMIAAMDENGYCQFAAIGNVAGRARVTEEEARAAIAVLEAPDPESSDDANEGRRIERVPGGWMVLNAPKYRAIVTRVNAQERTKERVRRFREKNHIVTGGNAHVTEGNVKVTPSETETETKAETRGRKTPPLEDDGSELMLAAWLFEEANVPCDNSMVRVCGDCIRKLAREAGMDYRGAADTILEAAKASIASGEPITRFWLTDQKYKPQKAKKTERQKRIDAWEPKIDD